MSKLTFRLTSIIQPAINDPLTHHAIPLRGGLHVFATFDDANRHLLIRCWRVGIDPSKIEIKTVVDHATQSLRSLGYNYIRQQYGGTPRKQPNKAKKMCHISDIEFWMQPAEKTQ